MKIPSQAIQEIRHIIVKLLNYLKNVVKNFLLIVINLFICFLSKIFPIDKNKVVYIPAHFHVKGNGFYLMEEWIKVPEFRHFYLCNSFQTCTKDFDKNNVTFCSFGLKFIYHLATAGYLIRESEYNSIGIINNPKTIVVQLWHAAGAFKKFGLDIRNRSIMLKFFRKQDMKRWDVIFCSSDELKDIYARAFGNVDKNKIVVSGLPRNDYLFKLNEKRFSTRKNMNITTNEKVILYAPTFRDKKIASDYKFIYNLIDFFTRTFKEDYILAIRLHPIIPKKVKDEIHYNSRILDFDKLDTELALVVSDILITDYSSIIFDFALLEKPILFYAPDLATYYDKRGFYFKYNEFVPGPILYTPEELFDFISNMNYREIASRVKIFKKKFNPYFDGYNSKSALSYILKIYK